LARFTDSGDVGIGTDAPGYFVHAYRSAAAAVSMNVENPSGGATAQAQLVARNNAGASAVLGITGSGFGTSGGLTSGDAHVSATLTRLVVRTTGLNDIIFAPNGTERMRLESGGDIGIGTTNPDHSLHIYDNSSAIAAVGLKIQQAGTGDARLQFTQQSTNWTIGIDGSLGDNFSVSPSTDLSQVTGLTVKTTGYTGINNTAPGAMLHVGPGTVGTLGFYTGGIQISPNVTVAGLHLKNSLGQEMGMFAHSNGNNYVGSFSNHDLGIRTNNADRITILANGDVGIGDATPTFKLDVNGTLRAVGLMSANAGISFGGSTLSTYEEGTWTPDLRFGSLKVGLAGTQVGKYTRIGNLVHVECRIQLTSKGSSTGSAAVFGLPFAAAATYKAVAPVDYDILQTSVINMMVTTIASATQLSVVTNTAANTGTLALQNTQVSNTTILEFSLTYFTS
jgi:hypothetical protein